MFRLAPLVLFLVSLPAPGQAAAPYPNAATFGVPFSEDEAWYRQCKRVEHRGAPDPGARAAGAAQCDATGMYYDKRSQARTSAAEWKAVRECALAGGDRAVLMMLYANGFGVERDIDVAMHYACSLEFSAKAEMEGRIAHLASMRPGSPLFDQCDDITSGHMGAICADVREAERRWIAYRDAFLAFGARLSPGSDNHAIHALLLRQRIGALHRVARYR